MERKQKESNFGSIFSRRAGEETESLHKCFRVEWKGIEKKKRGRQRAGTKVLLQTQGKESGRGSREFVQ